MRGSFSFSPRPRLGRAFVRACRVLCVRVCECDWHAYASDCAERRADLTTCEFFLYSPLSGSGVILFLYYFPFFWWPLGTCRGFSFVQMGSASLYGRESGKDDRR